MRDFDFRGSEILVDSAGTPATGTPASAPEDRLPLGGGCEARSWAPGAVAPPGSAWMPVRGLLGALPPDESGAVLRALSLFAWRPTARFCGRCGAALVDCGLETAHEAAADSGDEGARRCPACGLLVFPRISPAVIVLVTRGREALLARNARFPGGRFGLIAGFVEAGESLEETARRELREEAGVEVGEFAYRGSQPWPFPDSLMVAFTAPWLSGEPRPDGREIVELRFCGPDSLPPIPPPGSIARRLIDGFLAEA